MIFQFYVLSTVKVQFSSSKKKKTLTTTLIISNKLDDHSTPHSKLFIRNVTFSMSE